MFQMEGVDFVALNGGPAYQISPAISFMVNCRTREKIDDLWNKLTNGGQIMMEIGTYPYSERYGWVQDKYGVSWQLTLRDESQIIAPCLMFSGEQGGKAEEAMNFYMSVFERSAVETIEKYEPGEEGPTGRVKYAAFSLNGQNYKVMDAGREVPFGFNPGISFAVNCSEQKEIDYYWDILSQGGDESSRQCGWLKDKYGVSWQIVPEKLGLWISDESEKGNAVMNALMRMVKLDMNILEAAYNGQSLNMNNPDNDYEEIGANYEGTEKSYKRQKTQSPNEEL
jgi:predicted 3-demethylubiquinone-9 3-methyltransferase (glyoxalase superfamily)